MLAERFKPILQKRLGLALGLWGEAGIGKSYQVTQLLRSLLCKSASLHATTPLSVLAKTLPKPKKLATWAERTLTQLGKGETVEASNVINALGATLAGLGPFVLHLEDIHEADNERLDFIQELAKVVLRIKGVGLVVTSRKEPPEPFTAIKLESLSQQEADQLLEHDLKASLPNEALEFIYSKAAGNPLYTLEYLRYLTRQGFLWNDGKSWHWRKPEQSVMPVTVEALIEQLLTQAKTEPLQRYVLETKAFLPLDSSYDTWQKVARVSEQELQVTITELSQRGIFKNNTFAHPLFREVTLKTLSSERKCNLARRAINILEDNPEQAAMFVEEAKLEPEQALVLLKKAAEHVKERNKVEAARFLAKAAVFATGEEKSKLMLQVATTLQYQDIPKAIALIDQLLSEEPSHIEALYLGALLYALDAKSERSKVLFARLPSTERESLRGVETLLRMSRALDAYDDFLKTWEYHKSWQPALEPEFIYFIIFILSQQAKSQEAIALATTSLKRSDLSAEFRASILNSLGNAYNDCGQHEQAEQVFSQLITLSANHLSPTRLAIALLNRAMSKKWLGRYAEARHDSLESYRLTNEAGNGYKAGSALSMLGELSVELGDYEQAETYLNNALELLRTRHITPQVIDAETNMSVLYLSWKAPHSGILALKHAYAALGYAREVEDAYSMVDGLFHASLAEAAYGSGTKALELASELEPLAQRNGTPIDIYYAAWAKAKAFNVLKDIDKAKDMFQKAFEVAYQAKHELMANKLGLELDRLNNDVESARTRMQWFEERGLMNGVNIAKRYFPELAESREAITPAKSSMRLEVLGSLQTQGDKQTPIRGRKRQELLAHLLEAKISGRSEVTRLTLLDTLYPDEDELKAGSSLKVVVHSLRETFGENFITTTNTGYALGECSTDAELFLQTGDTSLWRGPYLEDLELSEDSTVRESLYLALFEKTKALLEDNPKEGARVGNILIEADPYNFDYLKTYFTALRLSNNHGKLTRHYAEARTRMLEVNEILPETWQGFLS